MVPSPTLLIFARSDVALIPMLHIIRIKRNKKDIFEIIKVAKIFYADHAIKRPKIICKMKKKAIFENVKLPNATLNLIWTKPSKGWNCKNLIFN